MSETGQQPPQRPWEDRDPFRAERPTPPQRPTGFARYRMFFILIAAFVVIAVVKGSLDKVDTQGARQSRFVVVSDVLGSAPGKPRLVPAVGVIPAGGGEDKPLLVLIAGRDHLLESLLDDGFYASLAATGLDAPNVAILSVDRDSGAHDRDDGKWGTYIVDEAIPKAVEQMGADPERVAIGGFDIGGFGALDLARKQPERFCAVGAHSPEIWARFGDAPKGLFTDAADFSEHDLLGLAIDGTFPAQRALRIDVGSEDPQLADVTRFVQGLRDAGQDVTFAKPFAGRGTVAHWKDNSGNLLRFYAKALADCTAR